MLQQFANLEDLSRAAADVFCHIARHAIDARGVCTVALSAGTTPRHLYRMLSGQPYRSLIGWAEVEFFWTDERAVPPTDNASNFKLVNELLIEPLGVSDGRVHRIAAEQPDLDSVARAYEDEIARVFNAQRSKVPPRFDFMLLGLGADGHTASMFPKTPAARETTRWVAEGRAPTTPVRRMTMTMPLVNQSRHITVLVAGAEKAEALAGVVRGPRDPDQLPAQLLQPVSGELLWLVDQAASALLERP